MSATQSTDVVPEVVGRASREGRGRRELALWGYGALGIATIVLVWELYKWLAPDNGIVIGGLRVLPRTTDLAMPHIWENSH